MFSTVHKKLSFEMVCAYLGGGLGALDREVHGSRGGASRGSSRSRGGDWSGTMRGSRSMPGGGGRSFVFGRTGADFVLQVLEEVDVTVHSLGNRVDGNDGSF